MTGPETIAAFDRLVDEARAEGLQRHSGEHRVSIPRRGGPEPILTLGNYGLTGVDPAVRKRQGLALPTSVALHAAAALALVIVPLLLSEALPEPDGGTRAFFVEPIAAPPPPPPPPPAARAAAATRVVPKATASPRPASSRRSRCRPRSSRRRASTSAESRAGWPVESRAAFPAAWWAVSSEGCRMRLRRRRRSRCAWAATSASRARSSTWRRSTPSSR